MQAPDKIKKLVEDFQLHEETYLSKKFQETETRNNFIDPFFGALGWEFNQTSLIRKFWDVHREVSQKVGSSTKKPDYAFRIDGKLKFFVEAKAPWVRIIQNPDPDTMYQVKRYAYSTNGKAPIAIITDFQEFRVFNALQLPNYENPNQGVLKEFDLTYKKYLDKWEFLYTYFSKEAVKSGSIERLRSEKLSKNTKPLDVAFLEQIIEWREKLAKNIANANESLNVDEINEAVQRILDRLIFIRNLEDRDILKENTLLEFSKSTQNVYQKLLPLFRELNGSLNGLLFKEHLSEKLNIEDTVFKSILRELSDKSPFRFDVIEPEILGRIYEKFLGSKIRLTDSHRVKVELKEEVRHAGGVYYTPQYIVDFIVEEVVGERLAQIPETQLNKNLPEEIAKIKVLDPACGSGSFLLGAYSYLIALHEKFYASIQKDKQGKLKYKDDFIITNENEIQLSTKKKGEILKNNIFGVDIDREATEVSILSLYLKLLEQGIPEQSDQLPLFLKGKVLPDMNANVLCGNSLITRKDIYDHRYDLFDNTEIKISCLDWEAPWDEKKQQGGFGKIFSGGGDTSQSGKFSKNGGDVYNADKSGGVVGASTNAGVPTKHKSGGGDTSQSDKFSKNGGDVYNAEKSGGFDCVIGNPPYIRIQEMQKWASTEVDIYKKVYKTGIKGNFDIYVLFIERGLSLLASYGIFGMILPNKFFMAEYGFVLRGLIAKYIFQIVNFSDQQVFENATTYTNLLFLSKKERETFKYSKILKLPKKNEATEFLTNIRSHKEFANDNFEVGVVANKEIGSEVWNFSFGQKKEFFEKLLSGKPILEDITDKILVGLQTSADPVYILEIIREEGKYKVLYSKSLEREVILESEILKPLLKGKEIRRYGVPEIKNYGNYIQ